MMPRRWPGALLGAAAVLAAGLAWPWPAVDHAPAGSIRGAAASTIRLRPPAGPRDTAGLIWSYAYRAPVSCSGSAGHATGYTPPTLTDYTLCAWVVVPSTTGAQFPLSSRPSGASGGLFLLAEFSYWPEAGHSASGGTLTRIRAGRSGATGRQHVCVTHAAGATSLTLYYAGSPVGVMAEQTAQNPGSSGQMYLCQDGGNTPVNRYTGAVDGVRLYSQALSAARVAAITAEGY